MKKHAQLLALFLGFTIAAGLSGCMSTKPASTTAAPSRSDSGMSPGMQQKTAQGANQSR